MPRPGAASLHHPAAGQLCRPLDRARPGVAAILPRPASGSDGGVHHLRRRGMMRNVRAQAALSSELHSPAHHQPEDVAGARDTRPMVSVVVPAYNEAQILVANLTRLDDYLAQLEDMYRFEIIV